MLRVYYQWDRFYKPIIKLDLEDRKDMKSSELSSVFITVTSDVRMFLWEVGNLSHNREITHLRVHSYSDFENITGLLVIFIPNEDKFRSSPFSEEYSKNHESKISSST
jgi:hypothetical protein